MIKLGQYNLMRITRIEKEGYFLTNDYEHEAILFKNEMRAIPEIGSEHNVFVYSDAENPYIATFHQPKIALNDFALLKVVSANDHGAFMDWGIPKDLFIPFAEQKVKMQEGKHYMIKLFKDEFTERLLGSSKIHRYLLNENHKLKVKDEVSLIVWEKTDLGVKVIINKLFHGLIFHSDILIPVNLGDRLTGYVKNIREDDKIDITLRKPGPHEVNDAEFVILNFMKDNEGFMELNDDSSPEEIRHKLKMSKKTFKKAVGSLYKQRMITLKPEGTYLAEEEKKENI